MAKDIWLNLPVSDVAKSTSFYQAIGFKFNTKAPNHDKMSSFIVGDNKLIVNIFSEELIEIFSAHKIADTHKGIEVLFSLGADSKEEVDQRLTEAQAAGATIFAQGGWKDGWMYGGGFTDPDGHRWNLLFMDMAKFPI